MGYLDFLDVLKKNEKAKVDWEELTSSGTYTLSMASACRIVSLSICQSVEMSGLSHWFSIVSLDEEDIAYFKAKAERMLEAERAERLAEVNKQYDSLKS